MAHVDLAPTLAALAGTWFPGGVGALELPIEGGGDPERRIVLETAWVTALQGVPQMGLRTPRWKYMEVVGGPRLRSSTSRTTLLSVTTSSGSSRS